MPTILENSDYVVAVKDGDTQRVTLINPSPAINGKGEKIIYGIVAESGPDGATRFYSLSDAGSQELRSNPAFKVLQYALVKRDASEMLSKISDEERLRWHGKGLDKGVMAIGECNAETLPAYYQNNLIPMGAKDKGGHFDPAFAEAVSAAAELSRRTDLGDVALKLGYQKIAAAIRDTVKEQAQGQ